ncbi:hypothetical protein IC582_006202 [Cucumis melo]|uniref:UPF0481 protein At3g47200-like n=3 Tax=Cucumis melo TaxID=3656 RepID=A0A1S4DVF8_CUCME|nr:UPF0481 protein At3g47200-like [Cucumis melo]KAA0064944.1 UPF0481 protein [Cucumis melo var. makuwa]
MENSEINNDQVSNEAVISEVKRKHCGDIVISIKSKLEQLPAVNTECSIYRVPKLLCQMNRIAYVPQVISIGPFHHGSKDLNATERYKLQGLRNFLRRLDDHKAEKSLEELVKIAQSWVEEARRCYADPIDMDDHEFVKMMLVDGCFIVEFFILVHNQYTTSADHKFPQIDPNVDLLFYQGIIPDVYFDLIKLENQLPFFLLQRLFELIPKENNPKSLIPDNEFSTISFLELTFEFLRLGWVENYVQLGERIVWSEFDPEHLVDFLRLYYISSSDDEYRDNKKINILSFFYLCRRYLNRTNKETSGKKKVHAENGEKQRTLSIFKRTYSPEYWTKAKNNLLSRTGSCFGRNKKKHVENDHDESYHEEKMWIPPSITELSEAGVTIKKAKKSPFITNITFKNGVLEIPPIVIDDYFETITRNLIAYEHLDAKNYQEMNVISYILFMDYLISIEKDVSLLEKAGIIVNDIGGSDKEVSELFNNLSKFVNRSGDISAYFEKFNGISKALCEHRDRRWNKLKASLKHNYFNTPWAGISVFAATFIIVLTLLQTIFAGISTF